MKRSETRPRVGRRFRPEWGPLETRALLTAGGHFVPAFVTHPAGAGVAARPNTPVLPFGAPTKTATFIDPSVRIVNGNHVIIGSRTYVAPFAHLGARSGFIKIGSGSAVLDSRGNAIGHVSTIETLGDADDDEAAEDGKQEDKHPATPPTMIAIHEAVPARGVMLLLKPAPTAKP